MFSGSVMIHRTSPSYANLADRSDVLNQVELSLVNELDSFDNQSIALFGFNPQSQTIDTTKKVIHKQLVATSQ